ncbi:Rieske (2Fe-2S) protein [Nocardioides caeni]|uniref:Cytochrome bc1 complex Rieske iron-sulfur subunit n=2 Tax=Nocardioides caeni TaxID=574700 RepID=A0A4S8NC44_9ACTN|nr:Rieske (2Fe-2S) protein [Nocardioides caeni]
MHRRHALRGAVTLGAAAPLVAACSGSDDGTATDATSPSTPTSTSPTSTGSAPDGGTTPDAEGTAPAVGLVATADVPVGGGVILSEEELVVTQPGDGSFVAFTAICTHQGCLVGSVGDGAITCPCHNSTFSITDGSVLGGPANGPLEEVAVEVVDGQVVRA